MSIIKRLMLVSFAIASAVALAKFTTWFVPAVVNSNIDSVIQPDTVIVSNGKGGYIPLRQESGKK